jgi:hypothetical protein
MKWLILTSHAVPSRKRRKLHPCMRYGGADKKLRKLKREYKRTSQQLGFPLNRSDELVLMRLGKSSNLAEMSKRRRIQVIPLNIVR